MQDKNQIAEQQKSFIEKTVNAVKTFISSLDKTHIQTVLLAGSTARGDFFPGEYGGMVDLIVMRRKNSRATAEDIFGANQEPFIPYHCIKIAEGAAKKDDLWLEIDFRDAVTLENFEKLEEPRKFSILEGKILYDDSDAYKSELAKILELQKTETARLFDGAMGYINYLLGDYKTDRWYRRGAFVQLHENLNTAIRAAVKCLYYINRSYQPAEDRFFYYSYTLQKLPDNYEKLMTELAKQQIDSCEDYLRREKLFKENFLKYLETFSFQQA